MLLYFITQFLLPTKPKKTTKRSVPQVLVLNDCGIDQAGSAEDLKKKCNTVKELDLAQNKLENWNEVINYFLNRFTAVCSTLTYIFTFMSKRRKERKCRKSGLK